MASKARIVELRDVVTLVSGNTPSKQNDIYWGSSVPWVSAKDMSRYWIDDSEDHLSDLGAAQASRVVPAGTVLLLTRGMTLHKRVPICRVSKPSAFNQDVKAVLPREGLSPRFLPYLMTGNHDRLHALVDSAGHGTGRLNTQDLLALKVRIPSLTEQDDIGMLGESLDRRIDLLRQTSATLESIVQVMFRSWFVDFDPVGAKVEGREPEGMDASTAALFPDKFAQSELGQIPAGWRVARLEDLVEAERGLSYKGAGLADSETGLPMHNLNSVLESGGYKYAGIKFYRGNYKERHIARAGDVIVANTEQGHHHRLIGFPAIIPRRYEKGLFSHHLYRVRPKDDSPVTKHWIYHALMVPRVRDQIIGCANGSTVNMLKPAGLQIPRLVVPPRELCVLRIPAVRDR